jgi:toxin FitB
VNVVDSSGWLEYFADSPSAGRFASAIEATKRLVVPTIVIHEVFKKLLRERNENDAFSAVAQMRQGQVVSLDEALAVDAAVLGVLHKLPMADSIILATARRFEATVWTQDDDFEGIEGVKYFRKKA